MLVNIIVIPQVSYVLNESLNSLVVEFSVGVLWEYVASQYMLNA